MVCPIVFHHLFETRGDAGAPLPAGPADQLRGQVAVAGDVPGLQHSHPGCHIRAGDLQRLLDRSDAVVEPNVGVPQRILRAIRRACSPPPPVVMQQHEIEIGVGNELLRPSPLQATRTG